MADINPIIVYEPCDPENLDAMIAIRDEIFACRVNRAADVRRKWREENKELHADRLRAWRAANPERVRQRQRGYGGKRRSKLRSGMSGSETRFWLLRQKKVCHWCGCPCAKSFHIDHIIALASGGAHEANNLCIACERCNLSKGAKDPIEFARSKGLLL